VTLRSGRWDWTAEERNRGLFVVYWHRGHVSDEMRTWVEGVEITDSVAHDLALDPPLRRWKDGWGRLWELTVENAVAAKDAAAGEERVLQVRFKSGFADLRAVVPGSTRLGDLTRDELSKLLDEAVSPR
jgi:hypothetical protein